MAALIDTFAGTAGTNLTARSSDSGHSWVKTNATTWSGNITVSGGRAVPATNTMYHASWVPYTADYDVQSNVVVLTDVGQQVFVCGRVQTSDGSCYRVAVDTQNSPSRFFIQKFFGGTASTLGTVNRTYTNGSTLTVKLSLRGSTITAYINGVQQLSATDTDITAKGFAGIRCATASSTTTTGIVLDDFTADDAVPASSRSATLLTFV